MLYLCLCSASLHADELVVTNPECARLDIQPSSFLLSLHVLSFIAPVPTQPETKCCQLNPCHERREIIYQKTQVTSKKKNQKEARPKASPWNETQCLLQQTCLGVVNRIREDWKKPTDQVWFPSQVKSRLNFKWVIRKIPFLISGASFGYHSCRRRIPSLYSWTPQPHQAPTLPSHIFVHLVAQSTLPTKLGPWACGASALSTSHMISLPSHVLIRVTLLGMQFSWVSERGWFQACLQISKPRGSGPLCKML